LLPLGGLYPEQSKLPEVCIDLPCTNWDKNRIVYVYLENTNVENGHGKKGQQNVNYRRSALTCPGPIGIKI
jgi:hypothetical protein